MRRSLVCLALLGVAAAGWRLSVAEVPADTPRPAAADGAALYDRLCLACHGSAGDGRGPGAPWLWPRPRDLSRGEYKWRSTPTGAPPTDADLSAAIRWGVPGTSMHAFDAALGEREIAALVAVVKGFAPETFTRPAPPPVVVPAPPAVTAALLERGAEVYVDLGCVACHGEGGRGDGPSAEHLRDAGGLPAAPYDLAAGPLRRPRPPDTPALVAIYTSLVTGLSGTAMPAYAGAAPDADLWAVAAWIDALRVEADAPRGIDRVHREAIRADRHGDAPVEVGHWPGHGDLAEEALWGGTIALQGEPPAALAPAQASLDALRCARCHARQHREWQQSFHAGAMSPGMLAQLAMRQGSHAEVESCQRCHAPLAEQLPHLRAGHRGGDDDARSYAANPRLDEGLRAEGITCAACHVRAWQRTGPPRAAGSTRLPQPGYPLTALPIYQRSDFCLPCHQLPPRTALGGRPLLDTYREWLEGPYMRRGIQCQHCHMPDREHTWKGIHDPDTFRQAISVEAIAARSRRTGAVSVRARVTNVGAGHYLPTTPTPAAWLRIELVDAAGAPIRGARADRRIGRRLAFEGGRFVEREDTRIPPAEHLELAAAWRDGRVPEAVAAKITVRVHPDDWYEGLYRRRLRLDLPDEIRALFEEALARALAARYTAVERLVPL